MTTPERPEEEEVRAIKVAADIADMLSWIEYFEKSDRRKKGEKPETIAQIVDPMIRAAVTRRYGPYLKRAQDTARARGQELEPRRVPRPPKRA